MSDSVAIGPSYPTHRPVSRPGLVVALLCSTLILASKAWYIHRTASPFPFWDQWDGEVLVLMRHYLDGSLRFVSSSAFNINRPDRK
jgi:hypothetical protein